MSIVAAAHGQAAISRSANRNLARRVIADVAVHIGIDDVLSGRVQLRKGFLEILPVLRCVYIEEGDMQSVIERPAQGKTSRLTRNQFTDDGPVARDPDI